MTGPSTDEATTLDSDSDSDSDPGRSAWQSLLHRWLIQYNPLYLVSAALVLAGVVLVSQGIVGRPGALAQFGITGIAETYAWALIGGAALLVRIRLRRPAVMLALLAAVYQSDLTLHTETSVYLGPAGAIAATAWFVCFVAKLRALVWAMQLRLSRSAFAVAGLGAAGVASLPWMIALLDPTTASPLIAAWLFALLAIALWTRRAVTCLVRLTPWGQLVQRRCVRGTWVGWLAVTCFHVGFWWSHNASIQLDILLPATVLLGTRWARTESVVWAIVGVVLTRCAVVMPDAFSLLATMAAVVLSLRATRTPRAGQDGPRFEFAERSARIRLLTGATGALYLAAWTLGWTGGAWPQHVGWLDAALTIVTLCLAVRWRMPAMLTLPSVAALHLAIVLRSVWAPRSSVQWGLVSVVSGFVLLALSLAASVRWVRSSANR